MDLSPPGGAAAESEHPLSPPNPVPHGGFHDSIHLTSLPQEPPSRGSVRRVKDDDEEDDDDDDDDDEDDEEDERDEMPGDPPKRDGGDPSKDRRLGQLEERAPQRPGSRRGTAARGSEEGDDQQDTNLDRPRAERRGSGGGPTRSSEAEEDEDEEDQFKSDLLMKALGLEDGPVGVFGWVQSSFTGNPASPRDGLNFGVNPNSYANRFLLQQFYFVIEKPLEEEDEYDYGFRIDNLFGTDWSQLHSVGLFEGAFRAGDIGYEPTQFYGEAHLPVLSQGGLDVKVGRFFALPGYESALAPARPLNSTGYMFSYAQPFTHIGLMSIYHATDQVNLYNGVVNGWDRWFDARQPWGYAGAASWDSKDGRTNLTVTFNWGANQFPRYFSARYNLAPFGVPQPPFEAGRRNLSFTKSDQVLFSTVLIHKWTEDFTMILETDEGFENNVPSFGPGGTSTNGSWYGLAGWWLYEFTERLTGVYRAEVFRDQNGVRTGFDDTYYEMTLGLIFKPRSWFWVRPETRFDWASGSPPFIDNSSRFQFTLGADAIFLF